MKSTIYFYGGAGRVTGANFLLDTGGAKFLVDCGLMQGRHTCEQGNWEPFPYDPKTISYLIVTHTHIDHIGRVPKLVRKVYEGTIHSTPATKALAGPLLRDAMELLTNEAQRCGKPPLYEEADIERALSLWKGVDYHKSVELQDKVTLELYDSGHILGSAMAKFSRGGRSVVFTGDLGGGNSPLLPPPEPLPRAQYLIIESVYGDRTREDGSRREELENIIEDTAARGGTLLIPAFSTERTQDLLFEIRTLMGEKRVPSMPVYLDSPLAREITSVFVEQLGRGNIFYFPELRFVAGVEESRKLAAAPNPKIILAGSGMSSGGRVLAHESVVLPDEKSTLLIVGYQAAGSLGRRLLEGAKKVELLGADGRGVSVQVRARVRSVFGYSAHMDGEELLEFINKGAGPLEQVFAVEGEPASASFLAQRARDYLGVKTTAPEGGEKSEINF